MPLDFNTLLTELKPLLKPLALQLWHQVIQPELAKLDGQISSADLKIVADALLAALNGIAEKELGA